MGGWRSRGRRAGHTRNISPRVLCGPSCYLGEIGGWQSGNLDLSDHLAKYRDRDLVVVIASVGQAEEEQVVCGICGFALN